MMPFPFFIPRDRAYETLIPTTHDNKDSGSASMNIKTGRHALDCNLYFGLDLIDSYGYKASKNF